MFASSHVAYIKFDPKKLVSDLFHSGSTLVESESIKRNTKIAQNSPKTY